jgi:hypothetical protein
MKKVIVIFIATVILVLLFFKWKILLMYAFGFRTPVLESNVSIQKSYPNIGIATERLYISLDSSSFGFCSKLGAPNILIFNAQKQLIVSGKGKDCVKKAKSEVSSLAKARIYTVDTSYPATFFTDITSHTKPIDGGLVNDTSHYDFTIIYSWAKYLPGQCKPFFETYKLVPQNTKVKIMSINIDFNKDVLGENFEIPEIE